jgi:cell division initiation protein
MFQAEENANPTTTQTTPATRLPAPERHVTVTPLDMRQTRFGSAMRGYDKIEVTRFLEEAAADYEHTLRENERLRQQLASLDASVHQYREMEGSLKNTLMSAQKLADDMRENALRESARLVSEAEGRADLLTQKAQARAEDVQREIDGLKLKRRDVQTSIEACVSTLRNALDFVREQDEREHRVVQHRPRVDVPAPAAQSA